MINSIVIAAVLVAQQPGFTPPPPAKPCLTRAEAATLSVFFLPSLIEGAASRCRSVLPADAFLRSGSKALADRLRRERGDDWPRVKPLIERISGEELPTLFGEETTMKMAEGGAVTAILAAFDKKDCETMDMAFDAIAPLPAENFGKVMVMLFEFGAKKEEANVPFRICEVAPS
jgi:hypothetical protein